MLACLNITTPLSLLTPVQEDPRRQIPTWAQKPALTSALFKQHISKVTPSKIFPSIRAPVLEDIFSNTSKPRYKNRTSSAMWEASPRHPNTLRKMF